MQRIDFVVFVADVFGDAGVFGAQQFGELASDLHVEGAHLAEGSAKALRHDLLGEAVPRQLRDVLRHVAHALERGADPQGADHDAQIAGHRLLASEDVDGEFIELCGEFVDLVVVGDHRLGE